jgi:hypothetical protein
MGDGLPIAALTLPANGTDPRYGVALGNDVLLHRSGASAARLRAGLTVDGAFFVRQVTDAGPMTATPGTEGEVVYNHSNSLFYGCTVTSTTSATWVAF